MALMVVRILSIICVATIGVDSRYIPSNQASFRHLRTSGIFSRRQTDTASPNKVLYRQSQRLFPPRTDTLSGRSLPQILANSLHNSITKTLPENVVSEQYSGSLKLNINPYKTVKKLERKQTFPDRKRKLVINLKFNEPSSADTSVHKHMHIKSKNVNNLKISAQNANLIIQRNGLRTGIHMLRRPTLISNKGIRNVFHPKNHQDYQRRKSISKSGTQKPLIKQLLYTNNGAIKKDVMNFNSITFNPKSWIIEKLYKTTPRAQPNENFLSVVSTSFPVTSTTSTPQIEQKIIESTKTTKMHISNNFVSVSEISSPTNSPFPSTVTEELDLPDAPDVPDLPEVPELADSTISIVKIQD